MRVQPDLPSSPLTATVIFNDGSALCACSAANSPAPPAPRIRISVSARLHALTPIDASAAARRVRGRPHRVVAAAPVRIHRHQQRPEALDAEFPQAFGIEIVEIDILDLLDPRRLQRRRPADDGEIGAADLLKGLLRFGTKPALADDEPHAVLRHQGPREALHARRRRRADTDRRVARRIRRRIVDSPHIGRRVDHGLAAEIELVLRPRSNIWICVASRMPIERAVERDGVADLQRAHLRLGDRHVEGVMVTIRRPR